MKKKSRKVCGIARIGSKVDNDVLSEERKEYHTPLDTFSFGQGKNGFDNALFSKLGARSGFISFENAFLGLKI